MTFKTGSDTVQLRGKRPTHTQDARTISTYMCWACKRASLVRVFLCYSWPLIFFVCRCLAEQTTMNDYSFLTETNMCFSARMYTCLESQMDQ